MESKYKIHYRRENVRHTYDHDMSNDQLVGKLAAGVAHEIKNPLNSIKSVVQLLKNMEVSNPEYYSMIYSEINKVEEIVNKFIKHAEKQSVNLRINEESGTDSCLMNSQKVIKEQNGTIQVKNEAEVGTTVDIHLPLLKS
ncbi:histidine kinase dimerization/phospho-acceptor domain-containing protein [Sporosarcina sp. CAU 1771]